MRRIIFGIILIVFAVMAATPASAINIKDLNKLMWVFTIQANSDGTLIDVNTITIDTRFTKTELKNALTVTDPKTGKPTATQLVSFDSISIYRMTENNMLIHCIFDSAGISKYCYILPTKIEPE